MSDIPGASGIYKITCTANKKIYVGSTVNLRRRQHNHFNELRRNKHGNPKLQNAWNKYGEQAFIFEVLEFVLLISLTAREQYWFKKLKPFGRRGFNIAREAGSKLGMKLSSEQIEAMKHRNISEETREKLRQVNRGNTYRLGKPDSLATRAKKSAARRGKQSPWAGKNHSPATREKMSQSHRGKKKSPEHREKIRLAAIARWGKKEETSA